VNEIEETVDCPDPGISDVDFTDVSAYLQILPHLFRLFYTSCGKIRGFKRQLAGNPKDIEMPPVSQRWLRSFEMTGRVSLVQRRKRKEIYIFM